MSDDFVHFDEGGLDVPHGVVPLKRYFDRLELFYSVLIFRFQR